MLRRFAAAFLLCSLALLGAATLETPEQFAGFRIGSDRKLVRWDRIVEYMRRAAAASPRVKFEELGKTTNGHPFIVVTVAAPATLARLDEYRQVQRRLVYDRNLAGAEARALIDAQKAVVLVTCNIHSTEIGSTQMALELVHRLATEDSPFVQNILDNVILLLVPSLNPDGQIIVTDHYQQNLGSKYEYSFLTELYHKYAGHDNNRDAFMNTQVESRLINRLTYKDWFPHVFFDEHQMGGSGARIFVPPFKNPINANVDPVIWELNGLLGYAMGTALHARGYAGVITDAMYTSWWQGGFLMQAWWHNMVGLLTEVASVNVATPVEQERARAGEAPRTPEPTIEQARGRDPRRILPPPRDTTARNTYPRPWLGGKWTLRDIVDYELTATLAALEASANNRVVLVRSVWEMNRRQIDLGAKDAPYAWVIPAAQHDRAAAARLAGLLDELGVEVHQATAPFEAGGHQHGAGSYVILMAQPYRAFAKDLLEKQKYEPYRPAPEAPPERPYDVTGWTLPLQMGVEAVEVAARFDAKLELLRGVTLPAGKFAAAAKPAGWEISHASNNSILAVNRLLQRGREIAWMPNGNFYARETSGVRADLEAWSRELGIDAAALAAAPAGPLRRLKAPRVALYKSWQPNMDEGWTRWLLEQYGFAYTSVRPGDIQAGGLERRFDAIILPEASKNSLLRGSAGEWVRPEHRGGLSAEGVAALKAFVRAGGTLVALGNASLLPIEEFPLPLKSAFRDLKPGMFSCPGSILKIFVDNTAPEGYGMKERASAVFYNNVAFDATQPLGDTAVKALAKYPSSEILESGWLLGEEYLRDRIAAAEVTMGKGRVVLLGFAAQNRAQPHGTFKLLFNTLHLAGAE
jgi:hypothetical protein